MELLILLSAPLLTGLLCRLLTGPSRAGRANAVGATVTLSAGLALVSRVFGSGPIFALGDMVYIDALGALIIFTIVVIGFLAALYSNGYLAHDVADKKITADQLGWYYLGYHAFVWTMLVTSVVNNIGLLWVAIEATTIISAILVGFYRSKAALEATWKYLVLCTVGITFAFFGVLLTYYASIHALGAEAGLTWTTLVAHAGELDPGLMKLAFVFILVGFGTKAGFAPLHNWLPDAHSQAPSPVSAVLSAVLLKCSLYGILRFHLIMLGGSDPEFSSRLLLGFGLLSVVVAVPFILVQRDLKRLLAYHSVEHIGLIAVAIGLGGPLALYAGLLHLFNHAVAKALLFFVAGNLSQRYGTTQMTRIRGAMQTMPLTGTLLLMGTLAITGVPPFAIFVTEFGIVGVSFARGNYVVAIALVIALAIVFAGAFGHAMDMALGRPSLRLSPVGVGSLGVIALVIPAVFMFLFGVYVPTPVSEALQQIVLIFGGGKV
ncbi:MAG: hydrogenase 4 subunit F [Dehalococcoidia bacterium]|nr:hydrogenase 4 subunit F [Dehalococcoidia bacterium]